MPHRSMTLLALAASGSMLVACASDEESDPAATTTESESAAATDLVDGLSIKGADLRELRADTTRCPVLVARGSVNGNSLHLAFNGESCAENGDMDAENGVYGDYLSPADVFPESLASDVTELDHPLGTLSSFDHEYVECTNECITDVSPMVILELDEAVTVGDVGYPTIVLRGTGMATADLEALAATIAR